MFFALIVTKKNINKAGINQYNKFNIFSFLHCIQKITNEGTKTRPAYKPTKNWNRIAVPAKENANTHLLWIEKYKLQIAIDMDNVAGTAQESKRIDPQLKLY